MIRSSSRHKLDAGEILHGVISPTADAIICEYLGLSGLDFYMMDAEHGPLGPAQATTMIRACENTGISPWARIRSVDEKLILQFLDAGIVGVMMPGIQHLGQVRDLVQAVKYPPLGRRGLGPVRSADYMAGAMGQLEYIQHANASTLVFPQMEDIVCMEFLDDMLATVGVDGLIIGPRDLAMSMGYYDGPAHPEVQAVIDEVFRRTLAAGKVAGSVAASREQAAALVAKGGRVILNSVQNILSTGVKAFL